MPANSRPQALAPACEDCGGRGAEACLWIVAGEVRECGFCALTLSAIAAHATCRRELVKRAVRKARCEELLIVEDRARRAE